MILTKKFYQRPAEIVARQLLGKFLVRRTGDTEQSLLIHETEAYVGAHDLACHGRFGCTPRTKVMFGPGGYWYTYLIYGMYWMLNIVTGDEQEPAAVLFRGAGNISGPGKLCKQLQVDIQLYGQQAIPTSGLWIEDRGFRVRRARVKSTPRIGIDYAGEWKDRPLRFVLDGPFDFEHE